MSYESNPGAVDEVDVVAVRLAMQSVEVAAVVVIHIHLLSLPTSPGGPPPAGLFLDPLSNVGAVRTRRSIAALLWLLLDLLDRCHEFVSLSVSQGSLVSRYHLKQAVCI